MDTEAFPLLPLAARAYSDGGACPAVVNAADEIAVGAFLSSRIGFTDISETVISVYEKMADAKTATVLEDIIAADRAARQIAKEEIAKRS